MEILDKKAIFLIVTTQSPFLNIFMKKKHELFLDIHCWLLYASSQKHEFHWLYQDRTIVNISFNRINQLLLAQLIPSLVIPDGYHAEYGTTWNRCHSHSRKKKGTSSDCVLPLPSSYMSMYPSFSKLHKGESLHLFLKYYFKKII